MPIIVKNTTFPSLLDLLMPHSCRGCGRIGKPLCDCCKNDILRGRMTNFCPNCGQENLLARAVVMERAMKMEAAGAGTRAADAKSGGASRRRDDDGLVQGSSASTKIGEKSFLKYRRSRFFTTECPHCHLPLSYVVGQREGLLSDLIHDYKYNAVRALAGPLAELIDGVLPRMSQNTVVVPLPTAAQHVRERGMDHTYLITKKLARIRGWSVQRMIVRDKNTVQVGASRKMRIKQAAKAYKLAPGVTVDPKRVYILVDDVWTTGASMKAAIERLREAGAQKILVALLAVSN